MFEAYKDPTWGFFPTFFTYFALLFGSGNSDESQTALGTTFICNPCL